MRPLGLKYYQAWDLTTRWFHWINVACVVGLTALGTAILFDNELGVTDGGKVLLKTVHVWIGYVFALNLTWRVLWAFFGPPLARWSALLPFRSGYLGELKTYVDGLARGEATPYLGHNPIARAMVALLLVLLVAQATTGLVLAGTDIFYPPLGHWIATWVAAPGVDPSTLVPYDKTLIDAAAWDSMRSFRSPFVLVHYWVFYALLASVAVHIAGVVFSELREGGGIISAMFTGQKVFDRKPVDAKDDG